MNTHPSINQSYSHATRLVAIIVLCSIACITEAEKPSSGIFPAATPGNTAPGTLSGKDSTTKVVSTTCDIEINFDDVSAPAYFSLATRITEQYAHLGLHFAGPSANNGGAVLNESGSFGVTGHSSPNFLAFNVSSELSDGGIAKGPETLYFDEPIVFFEAAFGAPDGGSATLTARDTYGNIVNTAGATIGSDMQRLRVMGPRITRVTFNCTAPIWVVDNICIIREGGAGVLLLMTTCELSQDFASPALVNLGYENVTWLDDSDAFEFATRTGVWDLIIVENYADFLSEGFYDALYDYHNTQGRILFCSWELNDHKDEPFVTNAMDVSVGANYADPLPVYVWSPTPLFTTPNTVPNLTSFINPCITDGARVNTTEGTAAAGYTVSAQPDEAALVINQTGRIILNTFTPGIVDQDSNTNGKNDMIELYENEIYLLNGASEASLGVSPESLAFAVPVEGAETHQASLENTLEFPVSWTSGTASVLFVCSGTPGPFLEELRTMSGIGAVDYFDARYDTPGLPTLLKYDVVLVASDFTFADGAVLGDVLADYVDAGGKVIHAAATSDAGYAIRGRFLTEGYMAFSTGAAQAFYTRTLGVYDAAHPIMEGITVLENYLNWGVSLTSGSVLIASWTGDLPMVATKGATIVGINLFIAGTYPKYGGDVAQLFRNAIVWLRGASPLTVSPYAGTLLPGETATVAVTADAAGLPLNYLKEFPVNFKSDAGGSATVDVSLLVYASCMEDAAFAQRPYMPVEESWGGAASNENSPYRCFENFSGLPGPITAVRWWGVDANWSFGFSECDRPTPDPFLITFYADEAGMPGAPTHEVEVPALVTATGLLGDDFFEIKEYEAVLPAAVTLNEGWISIMGAGDSACWFLWVHSPEGDGSSLQTAYGGALSTKSNDLSLCIATEPSASHPADLNEDFQLVLSEAIAYLAGWQQGSNPIGYAIRAAYLWQNGEHYIYDGSAEAPLCWVLAP